jgi:hypothetical protein
MRADPVLRILVVYSMKVLENRMLRRVLEPKGEEVTG